MAGSRKSATVLASSGRIGIPPRGQSTKSYLHYHRDVMTLVFEQIRSGGDRNFGYLLGDRDAGTAVLVDPSYSPEAFVQRARDQKLSVSHVVNTHGHPDHLNGNETAVALTGARVAAHPR